MLSPRTPLSLVDGHGVQKNLNVSQYAVSAQATHTLCGCEAASLDIQRDLPVQVSNNNTYETHTVVEVQRQDDDMPGTTTVSKPVYGKMRYDCPALALPCPCSALALPLLCLPPAAAALPHVFVRLHKSDRQVSIPRT